MSSAWSRGLSERFRRISGWSANSEKVDPSPAPRPKSPEPTLRLKADRTEIPPKEAPTACFPGSKLLFWILRLICVHPIIWKGDRFVVSGCGFACLLCAVAMHCCFVAVIVLADPGLSLALVRATANPIRSDMGVFMSMLASGLYFMTSVCFLVFIRSRSQIAVTFNELNCLWMMMGRPRAKVAFAAFTVVPWCTFIFVKGFIFLTAATSLQASESIWGPLRFLSNFLLFYLLLSVFAVVSTLTTFVYGAILDCLPILRDTMRRSSYDERFVECFLTRAVESLDRVMISFSPAVSPLVTLNLMAFICFALQVMFHEIIASGEKGRSEHMSILVGWGALIIISIISSHTLESEIARIRKALRARHRARIISLLTFQELDEVLEGLPCHMKLLSIFELNLTVVLSVTLFLLNFYMTFIQFKAILSGAGANLTEFLRKP